MKDEKEENPQQSNIGNEEPLSSITQSNYNGAEGIQAEEGVFSASLNDAASVSLPQIQAPKPIIINNTIAGWNFPKGVMVSADVIEVEVRNQANPTAWCTQMVFMSLDGNERSQVRFFLPDFNDRSVNKQNKTKFDLYNEKMKHIYEEYQPLPVERIGATAKNIVEYAQAIVHAMNTNGKSGQPIYKTVPVWLKFTYYNNNLNFPYSPRFIERVVQGKDCTLPMNPKYDKYTNDNATGGLGGTPNVDMSTIANLPGMGGSNTGGGPSF